MQVAFFFPFLLSVQDRKGLVIRYEFRILLITFSSYSTLYCIAERHSFNHVWKMFQSWIHWVDLPDSSNRNYTIDHAEFLRCKAGPDFLSALMRKKFSEQNLSEDMQAADECIKWALDTGIQNLERGLDTDRLLLAVLDPESPFYFHYDLPASFAENMSWETAVPKNAVKFMKALAAGNSDSAARFSSDPLSRAKLVKAPPPVMEDAAKFDISGTGISFITQLGVNDQVDVWVACVEGWLPGRVVECDSLMTVLTIEIPCLHPSLLDNNTFEGTVVDFAKGKLTYSPDVPNTNACIYLLVEDPEHSARVLPPGTMTNFPLQPSRPTPGTVGNSRGDPTSLLPTTTMNWEDLMTTLSPAEERWRSELQIGSLVDVRTSLGVWMQAVVLDKFHDSEADALTSSLRASSGSAGVANSGGSTGKDNKATSGSGAPIDVDQEPEAHPSLLSHLSQTLHTVYSTNLEEPTNAVLTPRSQTYPVPTVLLVSIQGSAPDNEFPIHACSRRLQRFNTHSLGLRDPSHPVPVALERPEERDWNLLVPHPNTADGETRFAVKRDYSPSPIPKGPKFVNLLNYFFSQPVGTNRSSVVSVLMNRINLRTQEEQKGKGCPSFAWIIEFTILWGKCCDVFTNATVKHFLQPWMNSICVIFVQKVLASDPFHHLSKDTVDAFAVAMERITSRIWMSTTEPIAIGECAILHAAQTGIRSGVIKDRIRSLRVAADLCTNAYNKKMYPTGIKKEKVLQKDPRVALYKYKYTRVPHTSYLTVDILASWIISTPTIAIYARSINHANALRTWRDVVDRMSAFDQIPPKYQRLKHYALFNVLNDVFVQNHHEELVKLFGPLLIVLSVSGVLTKRDLFAVWSVCEHTTEADVRDAVAMLCDVVPYLQPAHVLFLLQLVLLRGGIKFPQLTVRLLSTIATSRPEVMDCITNAPPLTLPSGESGLRDKRGSSTPFSALHSGHTDVKLTPELQAAVSIVRTATAALYAYSLGINPINALPELKHVTLDLDSPFFPPTPPPITLTEFDVSSDQSTAAVATSSASTAQEAVNATSAGQPARSANVTAQNTVAMKPGKVDLAALANHAPAALLKVLQVSHLSPLRFPYIRSCIRNIEMHAFVSKSIFLLCGILDIFPPVTIVKPAKSPVSYSKASIVEEIGPVHSPTPTSPTKSTLDSTTGHGGTTAPPTKRSKQQRTPAETTSPRANMSLHAPPAVSTSSIVSLHPSFSQANSLSSTLAAQTSTTGSLQATTATVLAPEGVDFCSNVSLPSVITQMQREMGVLSIVLEHIRTYCRISREAVAFHNMHSYPRPHSLSPSEALPMDEGSDSPQTRYETSPVSFPSPSVSPASTLWNAERQDGSSPLAIVSSTTPSAYTPSRMVLPSPAALETIERPSSADSTSSRQYLQDDMLVIGFDTCAYVRSQPPERRVAFYACEEYVTGINVRLRFLGYLLANSDMVIDVASAKNLWQETVISSPNAEGMDVALAWFTKGVQCLSIGEGPVPSLPAPTSRGRGYLFASDVAVQLFYSCVLALDFSQNLSPIAFVTWRTFFCYANGVSGHLRHPGGRTIATVGSPPHARDLLAESTWTFDFPEPEVFDSDVKALQVTAPDHAPPQAEEASTSFCVLSLDMPGLEQLWDIVLKASDHQVSSLAVFFLTYLQQKYSQELLPRLQHSRNAYISRCFRSLRAAIQDVANSQDPAAPEALALSSSQTLVGANAGAGASTQPDSSHMLIQRCTALLEALLHQSADEMLDLYAALHQLLFRAECVGEKLRKYNITEVFSAKYPNFLSLQQQARQLIEWSSHVLSPVPFLPSLGTVSAPAPFPAAPKSPRAAEAHPRPSLSLTSNTSLSTTGKGATLLERGGALPAAAPASGSDPAFSRSPLDSAFADPETKVDVIFSFSKFNHEDLHVWLLSHPLLQTQYTGANSMEIEKDSLQMDEEPISDAGMNVDETSARKNNGSTGLSDLTGTSGLFNTVPNQTTKTLVGNKVGETFLTGQMYGYLYVNESMRDVVLLISALLGMPPSMFSVTLRPVGDMKGTKGLLRLEGGLLERSLADLDISGPVVVTVVKRLEVEKTPALLATELTKDANTVEGLLRGLTTTIHALRQMPGYLIVENAELLQTFFMILDTFSHQSLTRHSENQLIVLHNLWRLLSNLPTDPHLLDALFPAQEAPNWPIIFSEVTKHPARLLYNAIGVHRMVSKKRIHTWYSPHISPASLFLARFYSRSARYFDGTELVRLEKSVRTAAFAVDKLLLEDLRSHFRIPMEKADAARAQNGTGEMFGGEDGVSDSPMVLNEMESARDTNDAMNVASKTSNVTKASVCPVMGWVVGNSKYQQWVEIFASTQGLDYLYQRLETATSLAMNPTTTFPFYSGAALQLLQIFQKFLVAHLNTQTNVLQELPFLQSIAPKPSQPPNSSFTAPPAFQHEELNTLSDEYLLGVTLSPVSKQIIAKSLCTEESLGSFQSILLQAFWDAMLVLPPSLHAERTGAVPNEALLLSLLFVWLIQFFPGSSTLWSSACNWNTKRTPLVDEEGSSGLLESQTRQAQEGSGPEALGTRNVAPGTDQKPTESAFQRVLAELLQGPRVYPLPTSLHIQAVFAAALHATVIRLPSDISTTFSTGDVTQESMRPRDLVLHTLLALRLNPSRSTTARKDSVAAVIPTLSTTSLSSTTSPSVLHLENQRLSLQYSITEVFLRDYLLSLPRTKLPITRPSIEPVPPLPRIQLPAALCATFEALAEKLLQTVSTETALSAALVEKEIRSLGYVNCLELAWGSEEKEEDDDVESDAESRHNFPPMSGPSKKTNLRPLSTTNTNSFGTEDGGVIDLTDEDSIAPEVSVATSVPRTQSIASGAFIKVTSATLGGGLGDEKSLRKGAVIVLNIHPFSQPVEFGKKYFLQARTNQLQAVKPVYEIAHIHPNFMSLGLELSPSVAAWRSTVHTLRARIQSVLGTSPSPTFDAQIVQSIPSIGALGPTSTRLSKATTVLVDSSTIRSQPDSAEGSGKTLIQCTLPDGQTFFTEGTTDTSQSVTDVDSGDSIAVRPSKVTATAHSRPGDDSSRRKLLSALRKELSIALTGLKEAEEADVSLSGPFEGKNVPVQPTAHPQDILCTVSGVDNNLVSLLRLLTSLAEVSPAQCQKLEEKLGLIHFLWNNCLFGDGKSSRSGTEVLCKTAVSRGAAFNLLFVLTRRSPYNSAVLLRLLENQTVELFDADEPINFPRMNIVLQKDRKSSSGYAGLKNFGCICYMNALLQQFYMIEPFRYGLLALDSKFNLDENELSDAALRQYEHQKSESMLYQLQRLFTGLEYTDRKFVYPTGWCRSYKGEDGLPIDVRVQQDAYEFVGTVLDRLENEMKDTSYKTLIQDVLGQEMREVRMCTGGCNTVRTSVTPAVTLSVDIPPGNLEASLETLTEWEDIQGYSCDACGKRTLLRKRNTLGHLSNTVLVHLKRFAMDWETMQTTKLHDRFEFPTQLDLYKYSYDAMTESAQTDGSLPTPASAVASTTTLGVAAASTTDLATFGGDTSVNVGATAMAMEDGNATGPVKASRESWIYELVGVVVHTGILEGGHYYSFIRERGKNAEFLRSQRNNLVNTATSEALLAPTGALSTLPSGTFAETMPTERGSTFTSDSGGALDAGYGWFRFDDEKVTEWNPANLAAECYGGTSLAPTSSNTNKPMRELPILNSAYMLVYERKHPQPIRVRVSAPATGGVSSGTDTAEAVKPFIGGLSISGVPQSTEGERMMVYPPDLVERDAQGKGRFPAALVEEVLQDNRALNALRNQLDSNFSLFMHGFADTIARQPTILPHYSIPPLVTPLPLLEDDETTVDDEKGTAGDVAMGRAPSDEYTSISSADSTPISDSSRLTETPGPSTLAPWIRETMAPVPSLPSAPQPVRVSAYTATRSLLKHGLIIMPHAPPLWRSLLPHFAYNLCRLLCSSYEASSYLLADFIDNETIARPMDQDRMGRPPPENLEHWWNEKILNADPRPISGRYTFISELGLQPGWSRNAYVATGFAGKSVRASISKIFGAAMLTAAMVEVPRRLFFPGILPKGLLGKTVSAYFDPFERFQELIAYLWRYFNETIISMYDLARGGFGSGYPIQLLSIPENSQASFNGASSSEALIQGFREAAADWAAGRIAPGSDAYISNFEGHVRSMAESNIKDMTSELVTRRLIRRFQTVRMTMASAPIDCIAMLADLYMQQLSPFSDRIYNKRHRYDMLGPAISPLPNWSVTLDLFSLLLRSTYTETLKETTRQLPVTAVSLGPIPPQKHSSAFRYTGPAAPDPTVAGSGVVSVSSLAASQLFPSENGAGAMPINSVKHISAMAEYWSTVMALLELQDRDKGSSVCGTADSFGAPLPPFGQVPWLQSVLQPPTAFDEGLRQLSAQMVQLFEAKASAFKTVPTVQMTDFDGSPIDSYTQLVRLYKTPDVAQRYLKHKNEYVAWYVEDVSEVDTDAGLDEAYKQELQGIPLPLDPTEFVDEKVEPLPFTILSTSRTQRHPNVTSLFHMLLCVTGEPPKNGRDVGGWWPSPALGANSEAAAQTVLHCAGAFEKECRTNTSAFVYCVRTWESVIRSGNYDILVSSFHVFESIIVLQPPAPHTLVERNKSLIKTFEVLWDIWEAKSNRNEQLAMEAINEFLRILSLCPQYVVQLGLVRDSAPVDQSTSTEVKYLNIDIRLIQLEAWLRDCAKIPEFGGGKSMPMWIMNAIHNPTLLQDSIAFSTVLDTKLKKLPLSEANALPLKKQLLSLLLGPVSSISPKDEHFAFQVGGFSLSTKCLLALKRLSILLEYYGLSLVGEGAADVVRAHEVSRASRNVS